MLDVGKLRAELEKYRHDPGMVAFMIRSSPEIEAAGLDDLAWALSAPYAGYTSYNDVVGLIDLFERWQRDQDSFER